AAVVAQQPRRSVVRRHEQVQTAGVGEGAEGGAARDHALLQGGAGLRRDFLELASAEIPEEVRRLRVGDLRLDGVDVVGDVAVGREDIGTAVEIEIEEETAE